MHTCVVSNYTNIFSIQLKAVSYTHLNFSTGEVEVHGSAIYHKTEYRERRNHYALYAVNAPIDGFDTDQMCIRDRFHCLQWRNL